jgi:hypothetical protein
MRTVSLLYCPCLALANQIEVGMGAEVEVVNLGEIHWRLSIEVKNRL